MISIHAPREGCDGRQIDFKIPSSISIHAPREGCDCEWVTRNGKIYQISIHAPREGCDQDDTKTIQVPNIISIHAPREGCDWRQMHRRHPIRVFQSTHPARGATLPLRQATRRLIYFNPRTPRGVRLARNTVIATPVEFQSTHPARGATGWPPCHVRCKTISIHAPREGCDQGCLQGIYMGAGFQSTHPARGATISPPAISPTLS